MFAGDDVVTGDVLYFVTAKLVTAKLITAKLT